MRPQYGLAAGGLKGLGVRSHRAYNGPVWEDRLSSSVANYGGERWMIAGNLKLVWVPVAPARVRGYVRNDPTCT